MDNYEIEQTLLGKLIVEPENLDKFHNLLHENLFEYPFNKSTYLAIIKLHERGQVIDILSVAKLIKGDNVVLNLSKMTDDAFCVNEIIV